MGGHPASARLSILLILAGCTSYSPSSVRQHFIHCPDGMAPVRGGAFLAGALPDEMDLAPLGIQLGFVPLEPRYLETGDFCMDRFEFPGISGALPRSAITFGEAYNACRASGKRLCTEAEFDLACGGQDGWHQPYGEDYLPGTCNDEVVSDIGSERWISPAGSFSDCVSPDGIYDLEGNVSEWVDQDVFAGESNPWPDAAVRGGTMWIAIYGSGCHARHLHYAFGPTSSDDGFRCCTEPLPDDASATARTERNEH